MIRRYGMALLLVCLMMVPVGVKAACGFKSGTSNMTEAKSLTMPVDVSISVMSTATVGQKVFEQDI